MTEHTAGRARRIGFSALAAVAAILTGLLTIGSTGELFSPGQSEGDRYAAFAHIPWLALGWCAAFVVMVRGTARRPAAMQQVLAMLAGLYLGGMVLARESDPVFYLGFGIVVGLLVLLHPARHAVFRPGEPGVSPLMLVLSLVALAPLILYAVRLIDLTESTTGESPFYTGIAGTALSVPLLGLAASLRARGARLPGWTAAIMLASVGVGSLAFDDPGSLSPLWAVAALVGAFAFAFLTERDARQGGHRVENPGQSPKPDVTDSPSHVRQRS